MAKKTWIKVKRGLLDPKHIEQLGTAWYLYLYILDQADWETGTVTNWKDEYAADDLNKPIGLIREHRKHLEGKYISKKQNQHDLTIIILNWTNPREYSGKLYNAVEGSGLDEPCHEGEVEGLGQGSGQGSGQGFKTPSVNPAPSYSHISHDHISQIIDDIPLLGSPFPKIFVKETGIPELTGGASKWIDAVKKLNDAGVIKDDLVNGIHACQDKGYSIVGLHSVVNPAIVAMQNRLKSGKRDGPIKKHMTPQGEVIE